MIEVLPPLLADIGEVIGAIVSLLFLVLWVVGQLMEGKKKAGPPPVRGQAPPPAPRPAAAPQPAGKPAAGGLRGEMDEFMRRAAAQAKAQADRPAPAQRSAQPAPADRIEVLVDEKRDAARPRLTQPARPLDERLSSSAPAPKATPVQPPRRQRRPEIPKRASVAEHVAQHVAAGSRAVAEQTSKLGQRIIQDDAQFDVQLKARFDHDVGTLAASRAEETLPPVVGPQSPAAQIAALLASPDGVRQAILLNEILRRPNERW
jgi:hypothetical protein